MSTKKKRVNKKKARRGGCGCGCGEDCGCGSGCEGCDCFKRNGGGSKEEKLKTPPTISSQMMSVREIMVQLWTEHVALTRAVIVAKLNRLPDTKETVQRLLDNQAHIAYYFQIILGSGQAVHKLLREHIVISGEILDALVDKTDPSKALAKWAQNGFDIADALYWLQKSSGIHGPSRSQWRNHMVSNGETIDPAKGTGHLDVTTQEAILYHKGKYSESMTKFDEATKQAVAMGIHMTSLMQEIYSSRS